MQKEDEEGMNTWSPMTGAWNSSTRSELAGLIMAMGTNILIHAGIDDAIDDLTDR